MKLELPHFLLILLLILLSNSLPPLLSQLHQVGCPCGCPGDLGQVFLQSCLVANLLLVEKFCDIFPHIFLFFLTLQLAHGTAAAYTCCFKIYS